MNCLWFRGSFNSLSILRLTHFPGSLSFNSWRIFSTAVRSMGRSLSTISQILGSCTCKSPFPPLQKGKERLSRNFVGANLFACATWEKPENIMRINSHLPPLGGAPVCQSWDNLKRGIFIGVYRRSSAGSHRSCLLKSGISADIMILNHCHTRKSLTAEVAEGRRRKEHDALGPPRPRRSRKRRRYV